MGGLLLGVFGLLVLAAVPIGFALAIAAVIAIVVADLPLVVIPQQIVAGMDSFPMLAVPSSSWPASSWTWGGSAAALSRWRGRSSDTSPEGSGRWSS